MDRFYGMAMSAMGKKRSIVGDDKKNHDGDTSGFTA
jgi:hypothetical protein